MLEGSEPGIADNLRHLADGRGISPLTARKLVKDFIADFLLTLAAGTGAVALMSALGLTVSEPDITVFGIGVMGAAIRVGYRYALRWALAPDE